jgi:hypothetical protein
LIAGVLLIAAVAVSPELRYFRYERPIQGLVNRSGQNCLLVDPLIFPHAAPLLADLRLYHDGTETPFVISTADAAESVEMSITPLNMVCAVVKPFSTPVCPTGNTTIFSLP